MARAVLLAGRPPTSMQALPLGIFRTWIKIHEASSQSNSLPGWGRGTAVLTKARELERASFLFRVFLFAHSPACQTHQKSVKGCGGKKLPRLATTTLQVLSRGTEQVEWGQRLSPLGPYSFIETHPVQLNWVAE